jgi:hypothetical protein
MNITKIAAVLLVVLVSGCQTMAESKYELNRRSGLGLDEDQGTTGGVVVDKDMASIRTGRMPARAAQMPVRLPPVIEKVWVYDQIINDGQWIQGTWLFVEIEGSRWLSEVDSGSGSFIDSGRVGIKKAGRQ